MKMLIAHCYPAGITLEMKNSAFRIRCDSDWERKLYDVDLDGGEGNEVRS